MSDYFENCFIQQPDEYPEFEPPPWPAIVFLHGVGERGNNLDFVFRHGIPKFCVNRDFEPFKTNFPFYVVAPQCPKEQKWYKGPVLEALDGLLEELAVNPLVKSENLYLTGWSLGGHGTWSMALRHPHRFAAIAVVSGRCVDFQPAAPAAVVNKIQHLPIWIAYGRNDRRVGPRYSIEMIDALGRDNLITREFDDHNDEGDWQAHVVACERTYSDPALYDWFLEQRV
jgi:predicted peptidase